MTPTEKRHGRMTTGNPAHHCFASQHFPRQQQEEPRSHGDGAGWDVALGAVQGLLGRHVHSGSLMNVDFRGKPLRGVVCFSFPPREGECVFVPGAVLI